MTTPSFEFKIKLGFTLVTAILALVVALAFENSRQFKRARAHAEHVQNALRDLQRVLAAMLDAETGMRGYVITGQEPYLEPYQAALKVIDPQMANLRRNLTAIDQLNDQFTSLDKAIQAQLTFRKSVVQKLQGDSGSLAARQAVSMDEGKRGMDEIRRLVGQIEAHAQQSLLAQQAESERSDARAMGILLTLALTIIGLLFGGIALVRFHIAERKRLEEEQNRFFTLSHDLYCIAGIDGFFKQLNPAAMRILGYEEAELLSRPFIDFVHPEDRPATIQESKKLSAGGRTVYFENRYKTKDGSYKWMLWSAAPAPDARLIYAVARDITEHKQAEVRLAELAEESRQRAAEVELINQELEAFSYSVSHDLRAPLRHIAGFSDMLNRHAKNALDEKGQRFLKTIIDSAKRMGNLIDDLLVFSRTGRSELRRENVDVNVMVDKIVSELQPDIRQRRILWKKETLPDALADRAMLHQVLLNLLSNAVKYTSPRDPAEISITARDEKGESIFCVRDNGVGFDMAYAHKLFCVFQRLHEASQFEGTGIGLANVRRIISRHGGRVWAEAELDKGAAFHFTLPKSK